MSDILRLKKSNCKNCYKCIRHCPVKSIRFSGEQAHIVTEACILCGTCFVVCPQNAKEIRDDVEKARVLINSGAPVIASVAPSFVANYDGASITSLTAALKKLGFADVEETAVGATMVKNDYERMVRERTSDVIITSCCHTVNMLIEKYHPAALKYLAPTATPMHAHCADIKRRRPDAKTIYIGPCISKKAEADALAGTVDCALTFEELTRWMSDESVALENAPDDTAESRARLFPTSGGVLKTMKCDSPDYSYMVIDGLDNCIEALEDIEAGRLSGAFIEMSACRGSCISGPIMEKTRKSPVRDYLSVARYAGSEDFNIAGSEATDIRCNRASAELGYTEPSGDAIEEILRKMGKTKPEDELNCGSCGYDTCREKAVGVLRGNADLTMCMPFLKDKAEAMSENILRNTPNGVIVLNDQLEIQQINAAALKIVNLRNSSDVLGEQIVRLLDPTPFFNVQQTGRSVRDEKTYLPEYDRYVEQSIVYDRSYHILLCILRDITDEERRREEKEEVSRRTVEVTDRIIEKQMRAVQEIASLLGESTAETKIALTKLKESLGDE